MPFVMSTGLTEEATSHTVQAGGTTIHYHDVGEGDPVLFLHTYGPGSTGWLTFHKVLGEMSKHYRCIVMDLANAGGTGPLAFHEPVHSVHARVAEALLDFLGIKELTLIGNSVGGTTSLVFSLNNPGRVKKLVIGACHASTGGDPYVIANTPSEGLRATQITYDNPTKETFRWYLGTHIHDQRLVTGELVDYVYTSLKSHPENERARKRSVSVPHSNLGELGKITPPTLIIHGRYDRMVTVEQGLTVMGFLPNSPRLVVLNNCGHWPPFEQPAIYTRYVLDFLAQD